MTHNHTAFLGAGHETTATGMTWVSRPRSLFVTRPWLTLSQTLWLLSTHPEVQKKLREEVADLIGRKLEPSMEDLNSLPYLEGVVKCVPLAPLMTKKVD